MFYVFLGILAFLLFIIYDINSIVMKYRFINSCFFVGLALLMFATVGIIVISWDFIKFDIIRIGAYGTLSVISFLLLIYTLFFALPFQDTYVDIESPHKVCQSGVYALCRHPGVLWFSGFYIFLGLALDISLLFIAACIFSLLNLLYVVFQDQWTFMQLFDDYKSYKKNTPFLIPNLKSIKRCLETL